jgi:mRNA-degrading endonuclease toxin of MazEF toxin-antitoxin module
MKARLIPIGNQLRTVDRERLARPLGHLTATTLARLLAVLQEMFMP